MKTKAIICDLDGSLSLFDRKLKYPFDRDFENDDCSLPVKLLVEAAFAAGYKIIYLSGRNDKFLHQTEEFLVRNIPNIPYILHMRKRGDGQKDVDLKRTLYFEEVEPNFDIQFVIDDRLQVCRLWYELGLFVFNVNQGLEEF